MPFPYAIAYADLPYSPIWGDGITSVDPWSDAEVVAERKVDGHHVQLWCGDGQAPRLLNRSGKDVARHVAHLMPVVDGGLTILDCELLAGQGVDDVARVVAGNGRDLAPSLVAFDVLCYRGQDVRALPFGERRALRAAAAALCGVTVVDGVDSDTRAFCDAVIAEGGEGVVLKHLGAGYGLGLMKIKRADTVDAVVTGIVAGKAGSVSLLCSQYVDGALTEVGSVSGLTADVRRGIGAHTVGQVVELVACGRTANGRLRHARLVRFRSDKPARECRAA